MCFAHITFETPVMGVFLLARQNRNHTLFQILAFSSADFIWWHKRHVNPFFTGVNTYPMSKILLRKWYAMNF